MSIQKRGKKWRAVLRPKNAKAITKTFATKKEAEIFHAKMLLELKKNAEKKAATKNSGISLKDFIKNQLENKPLNSINDFKRYNEAVLLTNSPIAELLIHTIKLKNVLDFVDFQVVKKLSNYSIRKNLSILSGFFEQAKDLDLCDGENPFSIKKIRKHRNLILPPHRDRRLLEDEEKAIFKELGLKEKNMLWEAGNFEQETILLLKIALETGMRFSEIFTLTKKQIFLKEQYLKLEKTKNGSQRKVPLSIKTIEYLEILMRKKTQRLFNSAQGTIQEIFRKTCRKLNIKDLRIHDLRHEATHRLSKKLNVLELAKMLGHKDLKMLLIYYNPTAEELAESINSPGVKNEQFKM